MSDILTDIRQLLLAFPDVTDLVETRIRPHQTDSTDGTQDLITLDLPDADQWNTLDSNGFVNGDVVVEARSTDKATAAAIAEAVRTQNETPFAVLTEVDKLLRADTVVEVSRSTQLPTQAS